MDFYDFTRIDINANIRTQVNGQLDKSIENLGKQTKDLMNNDTKTLDGKTGTDALEQKYIEMLQKESDWVGLYEKEMFKCSVRILGIIEVQLGASFVISGNINIPIGASFWYENAKRYAYSLFVFENKVSSDTINLREEIYELEFYVMGTLGIKAGVRVWIAVGILSVDLASVGFTAERA